MNGYLRDIVATGYSIENSIDVNLLHKYTGKIDPFKLRWFEWNNIRHLHILGTADFAEIDVLRNGCSLKPGYYMDNTESWLLIIGISMDRIQEYISRCGVELETLTVGFTPIEVLDVSHLRGLRNLRLSKNEKLSQVIGMCGISDLRELDLSSTCVGTILDLNPYTELETIDISGTPISEVHLDGDLEKLEQFQANHTSIHDAGFITHLPKLRILELDRTQITWLPPMHQLNDLIRLSLEGSRLKNLPQLGSLIHLKEIFLGNTEITSLDGILFPAQIENINLNASLLQSLPDSIRVLRKLCVLDLSNLSLSDLPNWLPELGLEFYYTGYGHGINLVNTKIKGVDMSIFAQPQRVVLQWFEERKKSYMGAGAPLNEVKVVFLGDGEAGKSHTIARLLNNGGNPKNFDGESTPGIVITDKKYEIGNRIVQVHFWDFGGQEILHSMHRMFLTERTLYVILINARDDTQDDRARYWLHNVKSFANGAPVLLVLNKIDQNPNASVNESDLRAIYPGLTEVVKMSAMNDSQRTFIANFTEAMKRQIGNMDNISFFFPATWRKVKQSLQGMSENYILGSKYAEICETSGVQDDSDLRMNLLNWFNDLGISICYGGNVRLKDYVILRPNWITNAVYAILFNKHPEVKNGIISHDAIFEIIQPSKKKKDIFRRANSAEAYTVQEIDYILGVVRKFRLSFQVRDNQEFIPMLCQRESLPVAAEFAADNEALEFHMTFDYLPNNVLHRLMVEMRQDLDTSQVWRTGACFYQRATGLSAVVKSEGNVLKIYVRSAKKSHKANTYLCIIKDAIDYIIEDMNIEKPFNEVIYKLEGKVQAFDYDELVESLDNGETHRYSRAHKRRLPIEDILNQTGRTAEAERDQLVRDVLAACQQLQAQKIYWNLPLEEMRSKEDIRNDYIRNALRNMKYVVSDQTRNGIAPGGHQAGRLDLDIRKESNIPWTIYEALNIRKATQSDMDRWDAHLDKLLGPYNPNGLPFLFLVSYVDCSKDDFNGVFSGYFEHLRFHNPEKYALQSVSGLPLGNDYYKQNNYVQAARCIYDRDGSPTLVYQLFVRLGE